MRRPRGTGSIGERTGQWEARYGFTDATGQRRQRSMLFDTKTSARQWLTARLAEVADGQSADPGSITVGVYLDQWLASLGMAQLEAATISWYRSAVQRHIIPTLGKTKLSRLSPTMIEAFLAEKSQGGRLDGAGGLGPASVRRLQITLHKSLDHAVRVGLLPRNPSDLADRVKLPEADPTLEVWTPDELARFVTATSDDRLAGLWRLSAMTGFDDPKCAGCSGQTSTSTVAAYRFAVPS